MHISTRLGCANPNAGRNIQQVEVLPVDAQELTLNNCAGFLKVIVQKGQADVLSLASTNEWAFTECLLSKYSEIKPITSKTCAVCCRKLNNTHVLDKLAYVQVVTN